MSSKWFYSVAVGRIPGVYEDWNSTEKQVSGFSSALYKKFRTFKEAEDWLNEFMTPKKHDEVDIDQNRYYNDRKSSFHFPNGEEREEEEQDGKDDYYLRHQNDKGGDDDKDTITIPKKEYENLQKKYKAQKERLDRIDECIDQIRVDKYCSKKRKHEREMSVMTPYISFTSKKVCSDITRVEIDRIYRFQQSGYTAIYLTGDFKYHFIYNGYLDDSFMRGSVVNIKYSQNVVDSGITYAMKIIDICHWSQ